MTKENKNKAPSIMEDKDFMDFLTGKFGGIDEKFEKIDERFEKIDERFEKIEGDIGYLKNNMVTKDYLDKKLAELEGKIILIIKRGEERFNILLEILLERGTINKKDVDRIQAIELFTILK